LPVPTQKQPANFVHFPSRTEQKAKWRAGGRIQGLSLLFTGFAGRENTDTGNDEEKTFESRAPTRHFPAPGVKQERSSLARIFHEFMKYAG
jgi:hypothetical protein